jgi:flagellar basal body P-ring formation protein FlgA
MMRATRHNRLLTWPKIATALAMMLVLLGAARPLPAAGAITILASERAEVNADTVLLGDIARISGSDKRLVGELEQIVIGRAPLPGQTRELDADIIQLRLKQHDVDPASVDLQVPEKLTLARGQQEASPATIEALIGDFVRQKIRPHYPTARVKEIQLPGPIILAKGQVSYQVLAPRTADYLGTIPLQVLCYVNGQLEQKVWVNTKVEAMIDVVVTKRVLGRYQPIMDEDLDLQSMDMADLASDVILDPEAVIGKRTVRAIPADMVLRSDLVELPPLVRRGDIVTLVAESESLKVTTLGEVRKTGRLGERIQVTNVDSRKVLYGRVVDAKTVKVEF